MTARTQIEAWIGDALELTFHLNPTRPGLTRPELHEAASRLEVLPGELDDALEPMVQHGYVVESDHGLLLLAADRSGRATVDFFHTVEPDYRDERAFEFVRAQLKTLIRQVGQERAAIERSVLVARGEQLGMPSKAIHAAITIHVFARLIAEDKNGYLVPQQNLANWPLPSEQRKQRTFPVLKRPNLAQLEPVLTDILRRRSDSRDASAEPLRAFEQVIAQLGVGQFRGWWALTTAELSQASDARMPTTVCFLSAALSEAALSFVVDVAQKAGLTFTKGLEPSPRNWKFDALLKAAKTGQAPLLDDTAYQRLASLNTIRNRVHAGRLLTNDYGAFPDTRPEEAREARATADWLVRRVLQWLDANALRQPASTGRPT